MKKALFLSVALFSVSAAHAQSFQRDGLTYNYSVTEAARGREIAGVIQETGEKFRLFVSKGRVSGSMRGVPVSFPLSDVKSSSATVVSDRIASR